MSEYKYQNPIDNGYQQFKLTKKQHNSLFKYRQIKWFDKYEYYYNDNVGIIMHRFTNKLGVFVSTILFPVGVLLEGLVNFKSYWRDLKKLYNQKESGSFSSDNIWRNTDLFNKVLDILNG